MKIICITEKLKEKVPYLSRITGKQASLPVLSGICIETKESSVVLTSTNIDLGISVVIPAKIELEGRVVVPGDIFAKVIASLDDQEKNITIEVIQGVVKIETESKKITLNTLSDEDFPTLPKVEGEEITIPREVFIYGVKSVAYSSATSDIKPEIASVYMYTEPGEMVFVSTDSFRLAEKRIKIQHNYSLHSLLIPYKNVNELVRLIEIADTDITLTVSKTMLSITSRDIYITSRVIDGVFPDYKRIIPTEATTEVIILKSELQQVLRLSPVFSDSFNQTNLSFETDGKYISWTTRNPHTGEIVDKIHANITGDGYTINCNHAYIQDVLHALERESVHISFNKNSRAIVIRSVGDASFRYLVMPLNR